MPDLKKSSGFRYVTDTKFERETRGSRPRPHIKSGATFKRFPEAETIILPRSLPKESDSLWDLLQRRRSRRRFSGKLISLQELASLLWAAQGITAQAGMHFLRTSPSAGALYPIETYVAAERVDGVAKGIYHFNVAEFQLEQIRPSESIGKEVAHAALDQAFIATAAATFIWSAVFRRNMSKYGDRGGRYIFMDAAHICQNVLLAAEGLGLAACPVAAFYDNELNNLLNLDGDEESVLYLAVAG